MSKRYYTIHKAAGYRLTDAERETLGTAWNRYINHCYRISLRKFARIHGVPYETWRREYNRGATYKTIRNGNRWVYAEYDVEKARESIREGKANMGTKMKLTIGMAILFRHFVLKLRRSPYDARQSIAEAFPDRDIPCLKTFYNHIEAGASGALMKTTDDATIISAIREIAHGGMFVSEEVLRQLNIDPPTEQFSPRQSEIMKSITKGLSNKEIAGILGIRIDSVEEHVKAISGS